MKHPLSTSFRRKKPGGPTLEVSVDSTASAVFAQKGGAHRIELCSNLAEGGVTPSYGLLATTREKVSIEICVMIRPRPGNFQYAAPDIKTMKEDIKAAKRLGMDGVVLGVLTEKGEIDITILKELVFLAYPMIVTFHRAFDLVSDPLRSLDQLASCGARRVLTSGQHRSALDGCRLIEKLVRSAEGKLAVMAGAGITEKNVKTLMQATGVREIHVGRGVKSRTLAPTKDEMAFGHQSEVDPTKVRRLLREMRSTDSAD